MDCNKDEAIRAKEIAEKKLMEMDIAGAKNFALKAQNLYPGLDGLSQLLATLEMYISAEEKINGEADYYRVLGVEPSADDDTIRRHFRKLALSLHPDKNKSVGAEGAFKILSEAWSFLSDKEKRFAYDRNRNLLSLYANVLNRKSSTSVLNGQNGFHNFANHNNANARDQKSAGHPKPAPPPYHSSNLSTDQKSATHPKHAPPPHRPRQNGFHNFANHNNANASDQKSAAHPKPAPPPFDSSNLSTDQKSATNPKHAPPPKPSFWTVCNTCKTQFEYHRVFVQKTLLCPQCKNPFLAVETLPPPINCNISSTSQSFYMQQDSTPHTVVGNSYTSGRKPASATDAGSVGSSGVDSSKRTFWSAPASASAATQPSGFVQPARQKLKRHHEEDASVASGLATGSSNGGSSSVLKGARPKKRRHIGEQRMNKKEGETVNQMPLRNGGVGGSGSQKGSFETGKVNVARNCRPNRTRELSQLETRNMLMVKAKNDIFKKLNEWSMAAMSKASDKAKTSDKEMKEKTKGKLKAGVNSLKADADKGTEFVDTKTSVRAKISPPANSDVDPGTENSVPTTMSVPDPDFHDFDKDRTEKSFGENQIWAAYDDDDGMPRYYAMIHSVISLKPFKMRISWLNSKRNNELGPINWVGSGFYKTSGDFRIGKHGVYESLNSFSHKVKWTKGARGAIQIYPMKGDVWALYRNWSPNWNQLTKDEVIHKYDMVEVLEDYDEEKGVTVAPLIKVAGFKTVFHKHSDPRKTRMIPRQEMFRFSHQVPSYLLTGQEGHNAPKDCWELDPASTPLELLQPLTEETKDGAEKSKEELVENGKTKRDIVADAEKNVVAEGMMKAQKGNEEVTVVYRRRQ